MKLLEMLMKELLSNEGSGDGGSRPGGPPGGDKGGRIDSSQGSGRAPSSGDSGSTPAPGGGEPMGKGEEVGQAKGTGYYPADDPVEGGFVDMKGNDLNTLQDHLNGDADYVSIALDQELYDSGAVEYGDKFRIPELEEKYGQEIEFRAVDTGPSFQGKGFGAVDICTATEQDTFDETINGMLTLNKVD